MKHIVVIILSIVLLASLVYGAVLYKQQENTKAALQDSEERRADLRVKVMQLDQASLSLRNQIQSLQEDLDEAEAYGESLNSQLSGKDKRIAQLKREKCQIEQRLAKLKSKYETRLTDKRNQLIVAHAQVEKLEKTLTEVKSAYLKAKKAGEALSVQLTQMTSDMSALKTERDQIQAKLDNVTASYQSLVYDLETLKQVRERIPVLEQSILSKEHSLSILSEKLRKLQQRYEEEKMKKAELNTALLKKSNRIDELHQKLKSTQEVLERLETEIQKCREHISRLQHQLKDLNDQKAVAEKKAAQLEKKHADLLIDIKALEKARDRMIALQQLVRKKNKRIATLEAEAEDLNTQITQLNHMISEDKEFMKRLKRRQARLKQEKALKETQLGRLKTTYDALISDLKQEIANKEITIETYQEKISVTLVDRILFDVARATISPEGRSILQRVGDVLKEVKGRTIRVVGHTDNLPISSGYEWKYASNWELSAARAASVVRYLQKKVGLCGENTEAVGRAFYDPVADNETEAGRAKNRRVSIIIGPAVDRSLTAHKG